MTGKDLIKLYKQHGWELDRICGSHHIMKKGSNTVSIPVHGKKDIRKGTQANLLKKLEETR